MRIVLYEHVTATCTAAHPLSGEGRAMWDALHADLSRVPGVELLDGPFDDCVTAADGCLLIAPETGGVLESLARRVLGLGGTLLGPHPDAIRLAADKLALGRVWQERGVPTPATVLAEPAYDDFPAVLKPRDGAGSESTHFIRTAAEYGARLRECAGDMIVQPFVPGTPAGVAFLVGPNTMIALAPARQRLSDDGRFHYLGGQLPLPAPFAERAVRLGRAAVDAVPAGLLGYVGVDLILGDTGDFAVEINPRITTSYVGLRRATNANLAEAMLKACAGEAVSEPEWLGGVTEWDCGGTVRR